MARPPVAVRPAVPEDAPAILEIVRRLARFEREEGAVRLTEEAIRRDGFGPDAKFEVLLAEREGEIVGGVLLFRGYSSWNGASTLTVHDLFVAEPERGSGAGRTLLAAAARLARRDGCCRLDLNVLSWNQSARRFYEGLGFTHLDQWLPYRLDGDDLARLAADEA